MKKVITSVLLSAFFLFAGDLWASNGFLDQSSIMKKHELKKNRSHSTQKLFADESEAFASGKIFISAGYGFPNLWKSVLSAAIADTVSDVKVIGMGPIHFRAEYALSDGVGFGVSVNYVSAGVTYTDLPYTYKFTRSSLSILARLNFHFGTTENLDPYFGVGAGYKQASYTFKSDDPNYTGESFPGYNPFGFETTIGVRYFFTPGFGVYTELGIAKSVIQAGLVVAL